MAAFLCSGSGSVKDHGKPVLTIRVSNNRKCPDLL